VNQRTFPGWGYMLENGATTLWEHWEFSDDTYSTITPCSARSANGFTGAGRHQCRADAVGFDRIILRPQPAGDLEWVKASHDSVHGKIVSEWQKKDRQFKLHIRVPVGAVATVFVPAEDGAKITEGGRPIERAEGVRLLRMENGSAVVAVGSGEYNFASAVR